MKLVYRRGSMYFPGTAGSNGREYLMKLVILVCPFRSITDFRYSGKYVKTRCGLTWTGEQCGDGNGCTTNGGISLRRLFSSQADMHQLRIAFETNVFGLIKCTQAVGVPMMKRRQGLSMITHGVANGSNKHRKHGGL
jgi:hypothetical protein